MNTTLILHFSEPNFHRYIFMIAQAVQYILADGNYLIMTDQQHYDDTMSYPRDNQ